VPASRRTLLTVLPGVSALSYKSRTNELQTPTSTRVCKLQNGCFCRVYLHAATRNSPNPLHSTKTLGLTGERQLRHSYFCTFCRVTLHAASRSQLAELHLLQPPHGCASYSTITSTELHCPIKSFYTSEDYLECVSFNTVTSARTAGRLYTRLQKVELVELHISHFQKNRLISNVATIQHRTSRYFQTHTSLLFSSDTAYKHSQDSRQKQLELRSTSNT